ncbi:heme biosynthesis HemY N-terminal domain-containing protein [Leeia oryzae]|uniref:heme biosynthesis HemY N-terminal domain-containing protein n=1 Tax=Leeia oryzae TaxID=356662 RepID=UPI0003617DF5|nr:heme biosynthesis HemY N-terminal domain-containing protein [Leeia oryzae]
MRALFWTLALFALAVALTLVTKVNTGYAILIIPPYRIDVSFNALVFFTVLAFVVVYFIVRAIATTIALPHKVRAFHERRKKAESLQHMQDALVAFFEGRYARAERIAAKALDLEIDAKPRAISALVAAASSDAIKNIDKRDAYLARSELALEDTQLARLMTTANMQIKEHKFEDALDTLANAQSIAPKLTTALRLELTARQQLGQHALIPPLIEQLEKSEAINPAQAIRMRRHALAQQLQDEIRDASQFKRFWHKLDDSLQKDPKLVLAASKKLNSWQQYDQAGELIADALKNQWEPGLALAFAQPAEGLSGKELLARIQQAEDWLKQHPNDASLLLTLGRLCKQQQLWGKSRSYLEASLAVASSAVTHIELARLLTQLEEHDAARLHFEAAASEVEDALAEDEG